MKPWRGHTFLSILKNLHRAVWPKSVVEVVAPLLHKADGSVISFTTRKPFIVPDGPENKLISQFIAETLVLSKRGEIQGILIGIVYEDGSVGGGWTGAPSKVLYAATRIMRRVDKYVDDQGDRS